MGWRGELEPSWDRKGAGVGVRGGDGRGGGDTWGSREIGGVGAIGLRDQGPEGGSWGTWEAPGALDGTGCQVRERTFG